MGTAVFICVLLLATAGIAGLLRGAGVRHRAVSAGLLAGVLMGPGVGGRIAGPQWEAWLDGAAGQRRELAEIERRFLAERLAASVLTRPRTSPGPAGVDRAAETNAEPDSPVGGIAGSIAGANDVRPNVPPSTSPDAGPGVGPGTGIGISPGISPGAAPPSTAVPRSAVLRAEIDAAAAARRPLFVAAALLAIAAIAGSTWRRRRPMDAASPVDLHAASDRLPSRSTMIHVGALSSLIPAVIAALTARVLGGDPAACLGAGLVAGCGPTLLHGVDGWLADRVVPGGRQRMVLAGTVSAGATVVGLLAAAWITPEALPGRGFAQIAGAITAVLIAVAAAAVVRASRPPASSAAPNAGRPRWLEPDRWLAAGVASAAALAVVRVDVMADLSILGTVVLILAAGDGRWAGAWLAMVLRQPNPPLLPPLPDDADANDGRDAEPPPDLETHAGTHAAELPTPPVPPPAMIVPLALATGMATAMPVQVGLTALLASSGQMPATIALGLLIAALVTERTTGIRRRTALSLSLLARATPDHDPPDQR
ncbi:MAG: hypothetical protein AB8G96_09435 [Phycisphaerales bacterium]